MYDTTYNISFINWYRNDEAIAITIFFCKETTLEDAFLMQSMLARYYSFPSELLHLIMELELDLLRKEHDRFNLNRPSYTLIIGYISDYVIRMK